MRNKQSYDLSLSQLFASRQPLLVFLLFVLHISTYRPADADVLGAA